MSQNRPLPDRAVAMGALAAARRTRARWLVAIAEGKTTPTRLLHHATTEAGKPLLSVSLRQILSSQPGWGAKRTDEAVGRILARLGIREPSRLTVAWLLDSRAAGARYLAWCDVLHGSHQAPWPGFPFTPGPALTEHPDVASLMAAGA